MNGGRCYSVSHWNLHDPCDCYTDTCDLCGSEEYLETDEEEGAGRLVCMDCFDRREREAVENAETERETEYAELYARVLDLEARAEQFLKRNA